MIFAIISAITVLLFPLISGYITKKVLTEWNDTTLKSLMIAGGVMLLLVIIKLVGAFLVLININVPLTMILFAVFPIFVLLRYTQIS